MTSVEATMTGVADRAALIDLLRCPCARKGPLRVAGAGLVCQCGENFPVVDGVPVLINDSNSVFARSDYLGTGTPGGDSYLYAKATGLRALYRQVALGLTRYAVELDYLTAQKVLARHGASGRSITCLVVGCGDEALPIYPNIRYLWTDIAFGPKATVIADCHDIPLPDGSVDLVLLDAVLEHVADPRRCVDEVVRVLREGGEVYAATPFLQPVHMGAYDFTRFTHLGHRRLFRWFDDLESGMCLGPGSVLAWSFNHAVLSLTDNITLRKALRLIGLLASVPLKQLDRYYKRRRGSLDAAGGTYFHGRKRSSPVPDREIIRQYRGLDSR